MDMKRSETAALQLTRQQKAELKKQ